MNQESKMAELQTVPVGSIDSNPFRQTETYPYVERKIETLQRSIAKVGLWEGVIARQSGNRFQLAFGHHRIEAGRRAGLESATLIVRDLTDEQMLQFMGRENMEDYNADFLVMLETWEATVGFFDARGRQKLQTIELARFLGWTGTRADRKCDIASHTARACSAAAPLIQAGYIARDDLRDLSVAAAMDILEQAQKRIDQVDRAVSAKKMNPQAARAAKRDVSRAAVRTVQDYREGSVRKRDLRGQVDVTTYRFAQEAKRRVPLFDEFARDLAASIARMVEKDSAADRLAQMVQALPDVTLDDDKQAIARIDFELGALAERVAIWRKRITSPEKKVTHLRVANHGDEQ